MKILVTGARGFVGRNLCAQLNNIRTGKAKGYRDLVIDTVYEYDIDSKPEKLDVYCSDCDFVFNLAGVNRPKDPGEFMEGNFGFASLLLETLKKHGNICPVMISTFDTGDVGWAFRGFGVRAEQAGRRGVDVCIW